MKRAIALASKVDPFGHAGQAAGYAVYRPTYPQDLISRVSAFCGPRTGQVAIAMANPAPDGLGFANVLALDRSEAQLSEASAHKHIKYVVGDAYNIPLKNHSADLVTTGQAAHWFDIPRYLNEVNRVLRPGATLAVMGYGVCRIEDPNAQALFQEYYAALGSHLAQNTKGCYWDCDRRLLDSGLRDAIFNPPLEAASVSREWFYDKRHFCADEFEGYLRTWSAYRSYCKAHTDRSDIVSDLMAVMKKTASEPWVVEFPFFLILGRTLR